MSNIKRNLKAYRNFVCPYCFNQLNKCICEYFPPYSLLYIDEAIQEHIRELNKKGYKTIGCCEGHYNDCSSNTLYIAFAKEYNFDSLPKGFYYNKTRRFLVSHRIYNCKTKEDYEDIKKHKLETLLKWINALENRRNKYDV